MTDRPDDELTPSDWLAAQFPKPAGDPPTTPTPTPTTPPSGVPGAGAPAPGAVPPPAAPPTFQSPLVNPFTTPQAQQYQQPLVSQPAPSQPAPSQPAAPQTPPVQVPPTMQQPVVQPPAAPLAAASAPQPPSTEPQNAAPGGFAWGLAPGGSVPPAAATTPPPATPAAPDASAPLPPPVGAPAFPFAAPDSPSAMPAPTPPPLIEPPAAEAAPPTAWTPSFDLPAPAPATSSAPPQPPSWEQPTQAISFLPEPTQAMPSPTVVYPAVPDDGPSAAELLGAAPAPAEAAVDPAAAAPVDDSALDSLFGEQNFRDYESEPPVVVAERPPLADRVNPGHITKRQKVLLWVAGGVVAVLALAALFLLGTRLPALTAAEPTPTPTATETAPAPDPEPTALPVGPVEPGEYAWDELLGGECIDPYNDPWVEEFTVVDCAEPHRAQMVMRGTFAPSAEGVTDDPFPGADALQGQLSLLCSAPGVIDLAAAGQYPDVQFQGSYPPNEEQWAAGDRTYFCFVSRASGEPLVGSVAVPQAPPAA
ncbi:septum formation family protein [Salinibacterium sp. ZJ77]|uniref:septum formation family protein n=1 Tax=Salinibacterium sp. ZJ77 TaxID=2708337 RepID=UPI001423A6CA|nr:septum formation family protein [Salinibacterium sp. ZJ77]